MKTFVFVFIPMQSEAQVQERLRDCLAGLPDLYRSPETKTKTIAANEDNAYSAWTWFVQNPRPTPTG